MPLKSPSAYVSQLKTWVPACAGMIMAAIPLMSGCAIKHLAPEVGNPKWGLDITWHGQSCFTFKDSVERTVVIDPFEDTVGYGRLKLYADALLISHDHFDHDNRAAVRPRATQVDVMESTGTITVAAGLQVTGLPSVHDKANGEIHGPNRIYLFVMGGLRCVHLGDIASPTLTDYDKKMIGKVDVLLLPVGGVTTIAAEEAKQVVDELKPAVVIPMHYGNIRFYPLDPVDHFLKLFPKGQVRYNDGAHLRIRESDLTDGPVVYILNPTSKN
jgi:L-ascorbate metabolism protein UlaG (beta-lactamase superfamily)